MADEKDIGKVKKPFWKRWWVWFIVLLVIIVIATGGDKGEQVAELESEPEGLKWTVIASWSGEGIKATETFKTETREWRINWKTYDEPFEDAGIIQIFVYKKDGEMVTLAANVQGEGSDTSYIRTSPGEYYLEMNSANVKWEVEVEEKR